MKLKLPLFLGLGMWCGFAQAQHISSSGSAEVLSQAQAKVKQLQQQSKLLNRPEFRQTSVNSAIRAYGAVAQADSTTNYSPIATVDMQAWGLLDDVATGGKIYFSTKRTGNTYEVNTYDNTMAVQDSYAIAVPESANSVQLLNIYDTGFFDTDAGAEIAIYVHYFDPNIPGPAGQIDEIWVIDNDSQVLAKLPGTSAWAKTTADGNKRLYVYNVTENVTMTAYDAADFSVVGSHAFSSDLILNLSGAPMSFRTLNNQEYLVVAHYDTIFMDNATLQVYPDNHLDVKLLDLDFQEEKSFALNIDSHFEDLGPYTVPMAEFGVFYKDGRYDLTTDVFDTDAGIEIAYGVHYYNLIGDDEWNTYRVANEDGSIVHQLDEFILSVNQGIKSIEGHDNQLGFLLGENSTPTQIGFFDIESWTMVATFEAVQANGDQLSDNFNRIPSGNTYHYLIGTAAADNIDGQVFGVVNEYSIDGQLVRRHQLPIAADSELFQPILTSDVLDPHVFTTESDSLYFAYAYLQTADDGRANAPKKLKK